ncbi:RIP metalloprotease RseP [Hahella sp. SMD15-11]|uniref:Zinc metalloprotease n=1 Tax=Thermohahella caldifontis TaxID=3142973 RepID=A0AB39UZX6_9GAMM
MLELLHTVLALVVTLGVLVTFHEYGHFWVARKLGVKVIRFSVGFGAPLWIWHGRDGVEYVIAAIPLGGYVKMLDEREGPVAPDEVHAAFNRKSPWARIAIAAAGPLANFLLAIVVYAVVAFGGTTKVLPVVGEVLPESPAAEAGIPEGWVIESIDNEPVLDWNDVNIRLIERLGETGELVIRLRPLEGSESRDFSLAVRNWLQGEAQPDPIRALGLKPWRPALEPVIGAVVPGSVAEEAGLKAGDRVLSIEGEPVTDWMELVERVQASAGVPLDMTVQRRDETLTLRVVPQTVEHEGRSIGRIGAQVRAPQWPEAMLRTVHYGPLEAVAEGWRQTVDMTWLTLDSMKKMLVGMISVENIGGPITIAKVAGATASMGLDSFLTFLAQLSITLAVLNILPIPVLDGGHILFYSIEILRGRPLSEAAQMMGIRIGMALIGALMFLAIFNDIARL